MMTAFYHYSMITCKVTQGHGGLSPLISDNTKKTSSFNVFFWKHARSFKAKSKCSLLIRLYFGKSIILKSNFIFHHILVDLTRTWDLQLIKSRYWTIYHKHHFMMYKDIHFMWLRSPLTSNLINFIIRNKICLNLPYKEKHIYTYRGCLTMVPSVLMSRKR